MEETSDHEASSNARRMPIISLALFGLPFATGVATMCSTRLSLGYWDVNTNFSIYLFLSGLGALSSLMALVDPRRGSFMLRGFTLFVFVAVFFGLSLTVRRIISEGSMSELPIFVTASLIALAMIAMCYRALRRDSRDVEEERP